MKKLRFKNEKIQTFIDEHFNSEEEKSVGHKILCLALIIGIILGLLLGTGVFISAKKNKEALAMNQEEGSQIAPDNASLVFGDEYENRVNLTENKDSDGFKEVELKDYSGDIEALRDEKNRDINGVNGSINGLRSDTEEGMNSIRKDTDKSIAGVNGYASYLDKREEDDVDDLNNRISSLGNETDKKMNNLGKDLGDYKEKTDGSISDLNGDLGQYKEQTDGNINNINNDLSTYKSKTDGDITNINVFIAALKETVDDLLKIIGNHDISENADGTITGIIGNTSIAEVDDGTLTGVTDYLHSLHSYGGQDFGIAIIGNQPYVYIDSNKNGYFDGLGGADSVFPF